VPFNQLKDPGKKAHYRELGAWVSSNIGGAVDAVVGAVGTGHSLLGIAEGITPRPRRITAEPASVEIPGVRNLETTRHGADDPCVPALFDERVVLGTEDAFNGGTVATSQGEIEFPESFRLVLGAAAKLASRGGFRTLFLVGAANRRVSVDTPSS
jgi:cysteine synthase A